MAYRQYDLLGDFHPALLAIGGSVSWLVEIDEASVVSGARMYDAVLFFPTEHIFLSGRVHHGHGQPTPLAGRGAAASARLPTCDTSFVVCAIVVLHHRSLSHRVVVVVIVVVLRNVYDLTL